MTTQMINTEEGINAFQMRVYQQGIKALLNDMVISRGYTSTNCRAYVTYQTGIKYRAGKQGLQTALNDLNTLLLGV